MLVDGVYRIGEEPEETSKIWNQAPDSSFFHSYLHSASLPSAPGATPKQNGVFTCKDVMLPLPWTVQYWWDILSTSSVLDGDLCVLFHLC